MHDDPCMMITGRNEGERAGSRRMMPAMAGADTAGCDVR